MDLTVSIVSYNVRELLKNCLSSIFQHTKDITFEVIVVDNASDDGSGKMVQEEFPQVFLIQNQTNLYFGKAHNQALRKAKGKYLLILNPDTHLRENAFKTLIDFMESRPEVGACGPKIVNPDGTFQGSGDCFPTIGYGLCETLLLNTIWPNNPIKSKRLQKNWKRDSTKPVDSLHGACFTVRKSVINQIGLFDEQFLLYWEEVDWCYRIKKAGWQIYFVESAKLYHHHAQSTSQIAREKIEQIFYESMCYYYKKHYGRWFFLLLWFILSAFTRPVIKVIRTIKARL